MPFPASQLLMDSVSRHLLVDSVSRHFRRRALQWTEECFREVLRGQPSTKDLYHAALALRLCGTMGCIADLKKLLTFPNYDVQAVTLLTIAHIAGASETPLYIALLSHTRFRQKGYALWAIADAADERALDSVRAWLRKNRRRWASGQLNWQSILHALTFLLRIAPDSEETAEALANARSNLDNMDSLGRELLAKQLPLLLDR